VVALIVAAQVVAVEWALAALASAVAAVEQRAEQPDAQQQAALMDAAE
jgi:hypothetical protein